MKNSKNILQLLSLIIAALSIIISMALIIYNGSNLILLSDEKYLLTVCVIVVIPLTWAYTLIILKRVNPSKNIYLSYSIEDKEIANIIATVLEKQLNCSSKYRFKLITADLVPFGANIQNTMKNDLARADIIIVIVSTHYLESSWCNQEFKEIDFEHQTVIPIVLSSFDHLSELPIDISGIKGLYLGDCQTNTLIEERLSALSKDLIKHLKN